MAVQKEMYWHRTTRSETAQQMRDACSGRYDRVEIHHCRRRNDRDLKPPWHFTTERGALLLLDMQRYFLDPAGRAYIPAAKAIVAPLVRLALDAQAAGMTVIATRHSNTPDDAAMMAKRWHHVLPPDDPFCELIREVAALPKLTIIDKPQYDAFWKTPLDVFLHDHQVEHILVGGVMANLCVETTARSAFVRGYNTAYLVDGTAAYNRALHEASLRGFASGFGPLVLIDEIGDMLKRFRGDPL